jgi:hypothetical protein
LNHENENLEAAGTQNMKCMVNDLDQFNFKIVMWVNAQNTGVQFIMLEGALSHT